MYFKREFVYFHDHFPHEQFKPQIMFVDLKAWSLLRNFYMIFFGFFPRNFYKIVFVPFMLKGTQFRFYITFYWLHSYHCLTSPKFKVQFTYRNHV